MKFRILFFLVLGIPLLFLLSACSDDNNTSCTIGSGWIMEETREVQPFTGIELITSGTVYVSQSDSVSIRVKTDDNLIKKLKTTIQNNVLKIDFAESVCPRELKIYVAMKDLKSLKISGSGNIFSESPIKSNEISAIINGTGNIELSGSASQSSIAIVGSGNINMLDFIVADVSAVIDGSGNIKVQATNSLYATINGSGNIFYKGSPTTFSPTINGSGSIIQLP